MLHCRDTAFQLLRMRRGDFPVCNVHLHFPLCSPQRFAAVIMRIREPKSTALIFHSGALLQLALVSGCCEWLSLLLGKCSWLSLRLLATACR